MTAIQETASIQELISGKGFIMVNKGLAKAVGLIPATIYGELVSTYLYWKNRDQLTMKDDKEWFFCTAADLEEKTTIKDDTQRKYIKQLEKEGLIETKRFGLPAKRYFHITDKYVQILIGNYFPKISGTDNTNGSGNPGSENTQIKPKIKEAETSDQNSAENMEKPRSNQNLKKSETRTRKSPEQEPENIGTNNKQINNKQINNNLRDNISQSSIEPKYSNRHNIEKEINELLEKKEMPITALKQMHLNIDRLISDNISVLDVFTFYKSTDNTVNDNDFSMILSNVLKKTKRSIGNFHAVMKTACVNWAKEFEIPTTDREEELEIEVDATQYSDSPIYYNWLMN